MLGQGRREPLKSQERPAMKLTAEESAALLLFAIAVGYLPNPFTLTVVTTVSED